MIFFISKIENILSVFGGWRCDVVVGGCLFCRFWDNRDLFDDEIFHNNQKKPN
jgi:hypothetical protein